MAAVGLSVWLMERMQPTDSISGSHLQQLVNVERTEILPQILVAEAMHQSPLMLPAALSVLEAGLAMTHGCCRSALVISADQLVGIVTLEDINRAISNWEYALAQDESYYAPDSKTDKFTLFKAH